MGRIADALNKAQQERHSRKTLESDHVPPPASTELEAPSPGVQPTVRVPQVIPAPPADSPIDAAVVAYHDRASVIGEQYRSVRTRLLSQNPTNQHRSIAITSALPAEGKSVTSLNLAFVMAELRHLNVLVLDGDFRRHCLASMLGTVEEPGLAELILGQVTQAEALKPTPLPNLHFIPAGAIGRHNAAELLSSPEAAETFQRLRQQYHYVLVDTPPSNTVADAGIIGQLCDTALLVVRMHRTPAPLVKRAVRFLQANRVNVAGCILAGFDAQASRYPYRYGYYGYGYDYGYGYGASSYGQSE